jgi:hypothetical protein
VSESSSERKQQERKHLKKARIRSERVPEREDPQVEAKKGIKARKWIGK